jgi:hypothetical protein
MIDFTLDTYNHLIRLFPLKRVRTVSEYLSGSFEEVILLRHDVDAFPENSARFAEIQREVGVRGTYYFRIKKTCYRPSLIERIAGMGHEIGYHYEDVATALTVLKKKCPIVNEDTLIEAAYEGFRRNLADLRKHFDVRTICGHGSPLCRYDNAMMWKKYDYKTMGILGDAGRDIDFTELDYLTDTGRRWNGADVSLRDKVPSKDRMNFRSTFEIMGSIRVGAFPEKVMINFHPQRWNDDPVRWTIELVGQKAKNTVKYFLVRAMRKAGNTKTGLSESVRMKNSQP